jgi:hypothetical protein
VNIHWIRDLERDGREFGDEPDLDVICWDLNSLDPSPTSRASTLNTLLDSINHAFKMWKSLPSRLDRLPPTLIVVGKDLSQHERDQILQAGAFVCDKTNDDEITSSESLENALNAILPSQPDEPILTQEPPAEQDQNQNPINIQPGNPEELSLEYFRQVEPENRPSVGEDRPAQTKPADNKYQALLDFLNESDTTQARY